MQIFKETPARGRSRSKTEPIKELGVDKGSGNEIRVMNGRYGPYVTDGDLNASLRRGTNPEEITMTEALELLQARAERLASGGGRRKKKKKVASKDLLKLMAESVYHYVETKIFLDSEK